MATYPNKEYRGLPVVITSSVRINNASKIITHPNDLSNIDLLRYCSFGDNLQSIFNGLINNFSPNCESDIELSEHPNGKFYITYFPERVWDLSRITE